MKAKIEQRTEEWKFLDVLNGVQCSLLANINRSASTRPWTADDFRVIKDKEQEKTPEQLVMIMDAMATASQEQVKNG